MKNKNRAPENTSLTISLSKSLKARIDAAAKDDRRKTSPWCVIQLESILDQIDAEKAQPTYPPLTPIANAPATDAASHKAQVKYPKLPRKQRA